MNYYAVQHKKTGRFVSGTDFSRVDGRPRQMFATPDSPPLLLSGERLSYELKRRNINLKDFAVVVVEVRKAVL